MQLRLLSGMDEKYGRNVDTMPEMLNPKSGETPMWTARFMQARILHGGEFPDLWNYSHTSDLPIYPQSKKFRNSDIYTFLTINNQGQIANEQARQALGLIVPGNLADNYGAIVPDEVFEEWRDLGDKIGLIKVPRKKITTEAFLTRDKVLGELAWNVLARHPDVVPEEFAENPELLKEYFDAVASRTGRSKNMALFYPGNSLKDKTTLKAWYVYRTDRFYRSNASGRFNLDLDFGRFVGLAPEALVVGKLEDSVADVEESLSGSVVSVEQVLNASKRYVPEAAQQDFEREIRALYRKTPAEIAEIKLDLGRNKLIGLIRYVRTHILKM